MKKEELQALPTAFLRKKLKGSTTLAGMLAFSGLILFFFVIRDYWRGVEMDYALLTMAICTLGGLSAVLPEVKAIREVLAARGEG